MDLKVADNLDLKGEIIKYIKSKGKLRAVLFHKLLRKFCNKNSQFRVKKADLISCLKDMMIKRIIDIIIPELFEIKWEPERLIDLIYLISIILKTILPRV